MAKLTRIGRENLITIRNMVDEWNLTKNSKNQTRNDREKLITINLNYLHTSLKDLQDTEYYAKMAIREQLLRSHV